VRTAFRLAALCLLATAVQPQQTKTSPKQYGFRIVHVYPHDPNAFTQGLEFRGGYLYEGTGLKGRSTVRREALDTGKVLQQIDVPSDYFGEGITVINQHVLELTWQAQVGFIYDQPTFRSLRTFSYQGEGWGLANDGQNVYMSDGSAYIRVLDPNSLTEKRRIFVHDGTSAITELNELECVRGEIYANVWHSWKIARISSATGSVLGWIDCTGIIAPDELHSSEAVLNGIAYDSMGDRLFVTGKLWPKIFEIRVFPKK